MKISVIGCGLTFALLLGTFHLIWSILMFLGAGKMVLDFLLWIHFINIDYTLNAFSTVQAVSLLIVTTVTGFIGGALFAVLWNSLVPSAKT